MGAKKSKLNKEVLDELCSKTKFRNYFRESNVQSYSHHPQPALILTREQIVHVFLSLNVTGRTRIYCGNSENVLRMISIRLYFVGLWLLIR